MYAVRLQQLSAKVPLSAQDQSSYCFRVHLSQIAAISEASPRFGFSGNHPGPSENRTVGVDNRET